MVPKADILKSAICNNWQPVDLYSKQIGGSMFLEEMVPVAAIS